MKGRIPLGLIESLRGAVALIRSDGENVVVQPGHAVFAGDRIVTHRDSAVVVVLADGSSVSLAEKASTVLDEMIYDPATHKGQLVLTLLQGGLLFESGAIPASAGDGATIRAGTSSLSIERAAVGVRLDGGRASVTLLNAGDALDGKVTVSYDGGSVRLSDSLNELSIGPGGPTSAEPYRVAWADVLAVFRAPMALLNANQESRATWRVGPEPAVAEQPSAPAADSPEKETAPAAGGAAPGDGRTDPVVRVVSGEDVSRPGADVGTGASLSPGSPSGAWDVYRSVEGEPRRAESMPPPAEPANPPNAAPSARGASFVVAEDQVVAGRLIGEDADRDNLSFALASGGAPQHGTVQVNPDGTFSYQAASNYSGSDSFTYVVDDGHGGAATETIILHISPVADAPALNLADVVGAEDSAIALSVSAALTDASEQLSVRVSGVPSGATLSAGTANGDGTWTLAPGELDGLSLTPPEHYSGSFNLTFEATSLVPETGESAIVADSAMVVVNPVSDMPVLGVAPASGTEDISVPLTIAAQVIDPSETVRVEISGLPAGASLNAGADRGDGTWVLGPEELIDLRLTLPQDFGQSFQLTVSAVSTDDTSETATPAVSLTVTMTATGDISLSASSSVRPETNVAVTLPLDLNAAIGDLDASETLTRVVVTFDQDLPVGASVTGGTLEGRVLTIAADDLGDVSVVVPPDWSGTIEGTAVAFTNEGESAPADVTLQARAVPDAPSLSLTVTPDEAATAAVQGGFVSVWEDPNLDGGSTGIFAQRFDGTGRPVGAQFQVNTTTNQAQDNPSVAMLPQGGFVVTWESASQDGNNDGVFMRRYDAFGQPTGGEVQVNTFATGDQHNANVTPLASGGFLVTWDGRGADDTQGIFARHYGVDGQALGSEFRVNSTVSGTQGASAASALPDGGFVIAWQGAGTGDTTGVFARRFNASGSPLGNEFRVNVTTSQTQDLPDVVGLDDGGVVVVWHGRGGTDANGIYLRRFDGSGTPIGGEVMVNATSTGTQTRPTVAQLDDGSFVVAWEGTGSDDNSSIYAQRFTAGGARLGAEFRINTETANTQDYPSITALADGGFAVHWQSVGQDGSQQGIFGRSFDAAGTPTGAEFQVNTIVQGAQADPDVAGLVAGSGAQFFNVGVDAAFGDYQDASESHQVRIDVPEGFALLSDPSTWTDLPSGVSASLIDGDVVFTANTGEEGVDSFFYEFPVLQESSAAEASFAGFAQATEIDTGEAATTAAYSQLLLGTPGDDTLSGSAAAETVYSGFGDDMVAAGGGSDYAYGGEGSDSISGGDGSDTLEGGAGDDTLSGGAGDDVFNFVPENESGSSDVVTDFSSGDELRISGGATDLADLSFQQVGDDTVVQIGGHDASITLEDVQADQLVSYQLTPDPNSDLIVVFSDTEGRRGMG